MENEETEKENGSEGAVQERTFNYFAWPQPKVLNLFFFKHDGHAKKGLSVVSECVVGVWDAWMSVRFPCLKFCLSPALVKVSRLDTDECCNNAVYIY